MGHEVFNSPGESTSSKSLKSNRGDQVASKASDRLTLMGSLFRIWSAVASVLLLAGLASPQHGQNAAGGVRQAQQWMSSGQDERAEALLSSILQAEPNNSSALTLMGILRAQQGKSEEAEQFLRRAIAANPDDLPAWNNLGALQLSGKRYQDALDTFEAGLKKNPDDDSLRRGEKQAAILLAQEQIQAHNQEGALIGLLRANRYLPDDADLLTKLGILEDRMKIFHDADAALRRSLALRPDDPTSLYALAHLKTDQQMPSEAAAYMRRYLALKPDDASAHYGMGRILRLAGKPDEAAKEYDRSIALQPQQTESYYELAEMAVDNKHDDEAEQLLQKVLVRDPKHGGALTEMGVIAFRRKNYAKAEDYLRLAITNVPDYGPAHYQYALALSRMGRIEEAQQEFATASALNRSPVEKSSGTVQLKEPER